jgi:glycosyltransferase involved in cell wall biosynthesis
VARVMYLCNAIDDHTRAARNVTSDSPAATQKVLQVAKAVRVSGGRMIVISLGRGRQDNSWRWFGTAVRRVNGVPVLYLPFIHAPVLSHVVSLVSAAIYVLKLERRLPAKLLTYNRSPHYLLALLAGRLARIASFVDIEDGFPPAHTKLSRLRLLLTRGLYNRLAPNGALLACRALAQEYHVAKTMVCYGTCDIVHRVRTCDAGSLTVLLSGSLQPSTGTRLCIEAIEYLRMQQRAWCRVLEIVVTGGGEDAMRFESMAGRPGFPRVRFYGRISRPQYLNVLASSHVGLSLKLPSGGLASTTFPSKVVEFAANGLLVVATPISDVRQLFGNEGALYLETEEPRRLANLLEWIVSNPNAARAIATEGQTRLLKACSQREIGNALIRFFDLASDADQE